MATVAVTDTSAAPEGAEKTVTTTVEKPTDMGIAQSGCEVSLVDVSWLKGHEEFINARYEVILNEIKAINAYEWPILVDQRSGTILDGHHRHQVALHLKLKKVPAVLIDYVNDNRIQVVRWRKELENWKSKGLPQTVSSSGAARACPVSFEMIVEAAKAQGQPDDLLVTKEEVVRRGVAGELYKPKSTRHLMGEDLVLPKVYVPLTQLY